MLRFVVLPCGDPSERRSRRVTRAVFPSIRFVLRVSRPACWRVALLLHERMYWFILTGEIFLVRDKLAVLPKFADVISPMPVTLLLFIPVWALFVDVFHAPDSLGSYFSCYKNIFSSEKRAKTRCVER
ncbi:MAG: hypothetical protein LBU66_07365 [Treponema sp.]|nr:hypothetical protein [Treponema sp.]